jgi:hypothetical protein
MTKTILAVWTLCAVATLSLPARAQLELPAPSPAAKVMQRVGLTDITVEYSSPAVKGRKIWGALVPFDKPWRVGANAPTKVTFSRDAMFAGKPVPAGTYALYAVPAAKSWALVLTKDMNNAPAQGKAPDAALEVARATATPAASPARERMTFLFSNTTDEATSLDLEWEKLRVSVPIAVDTKAHALASIKQNVDGAWRGHANTARWLAETTKDYDAALKYVDTSLAMNPQWFNTWIKADILAKKGDTAQALTLGQQAYDLGMKEPDGFFLKADVEKALTEWKKKKAPKA